MNLGPANAVSGKACVFFHGGLGFYYPVSAVVSMVGNE